MNTTSLFIFSLCIIIISCAPSQRPVIGIYTQDTPQPYNITKLSTYIASSYVKNLQMAGAQIVPIFYHYSIQQLQDILSKINGVFFAGGQMPIDITNQWTSKMKFIMDYATDQNKKGNIYPVWATCLSLQAVMYIYGGDSNNRTVLTEVFDQNGVIRPLKVKSNNSQILKSLPSNVYDKVTTGQGLYYFSHHWAVLLQTYNKVSSLNTFWKLITTSITKSGVQFVSTVQAKDYPFFMTQYHPEKNAFQWHIQAIRTYQAIQAQQKVINTFMKFARLNKNIFSDDQLSKKLIYNYPTVMPDINFGFTSMYIFDESKI